MRPSKIYLKANITDFQMKIWKVFAMRVYDIEDLILRFSFNRETGKYVYYYEVIY